MSQDVAKSEGPIMPVVDLSPDPSWRGLYRAGAWAAAVFVVLVLVPVALVMAAPIPPSSGAGVLAYIGAHRTVYLVELVCFVGLGVPALVVFAAAGVALKSVDKSMAMIGMLLGVVSETIALALGSSPQSLHGGLVVLADAYDSAATPAERAGLASAADALVAATNAVSWAGILTAAAILVLSLVMWRGPVPRWMAILGVVAGVVGVASEGLRPVIGAAYMLYGLLLPLWFAVIGWRLWAASRLEATAPRRHATVPDEA